MGFENDCILNIQSLAGEYFCAVCRTLVYPNEAMQAPCTHLYCKPCLTYVVSTTHACPYDGYRVTEADSKPLLESNKALAETIGKIQVHCLYYRTGCTWQGPLSDTTVHCSTCAFGESAVLCNRCGIQLKHRQVQEHAQNCSGAQTQAQQPGGAQDSTSAETASAPDQSQTGGPISQAQVSQALTSAVPTQDASQTANPATQPQAAPAATPTPEQLYQQQQQQYQQQYQQYYQQFPGYDPYQQNYQYYYQYPQAAQPNPQAYGQPQPQVYGQVQTQPVVQAQPQVQVQVQPQVPSQGAQPPLQSHSQPAVNPQGQVPFGGQGQPQMPAQGQSQPQMPAQGQAPPPQANPYAQPQPQPYAQPQSQPYAQPQPVPQQQYPQTHPPVQHPHAQPYPLPQTQHHYAHPQPQVQPQPNQQAHTHPPQQPPPPNTQLQTSNAVTGYQSFPQAQAGAGHPMHTAGGQYPAQMPGQFPLQTAQMRPPQSYSNVPNQQQPAMLSAQGQGQGQGQSLNGPYAQQLPVYPHTQQSGYPSQQRPIVQAAQQGVPQQYAQQQSYPGQGPYMQHQPSQMPPQSQQNYGQPPSGQPNVANNYAGRPMGVQTGAHPFAQAAGFPGGAPQVRPSQLSQNQPMKTNSQLPSAEQQATQSQRVSSGEKPHDPNGQIAPSKEARDMSVASSAGQRGDDMKSKANNGLAVSVDGNIVDNHVQEAKPRSKGNQGETFSEHPSGNAGKSGSEDPRDGQDLKHTANNVAEGSDPPSSLPKSSAQHKPGVASKSHSMTHHSSQLRPQGPGQAASSAFPHENLPGGIPSNVNHHHHQGNLPPHQVGQPQKPPGDPLIGSPFMGHRPGPSRYEIEKFAAQRSGHFDSRQPDSHPHGPTERSNFVAGPHGIRPGTMEFGGPSAHESMLAPGLRDERGMPFVEEHLKRFNHREFEDDFRKLPRPPQLEAGPSNYGTRFPSGPLDHGSRMFGGDGMLRPFDKEPHGFDRDHAFKLEGGGSGPSRLLLPFHPKDGDRSRTHAFPDDDMRRADFRRTDLSGPPPGPGLGRHHMDGLVPRSPGRDYPGFPSRKIGNDSRLFEGSRPFNFPAEPFGKPHHESRFPVPPRSGDLDARGSFRVGEHLGQNQDLMPSHLQRGGHLGLRGLQEFGHPGELSLMDPLLLGNFPPHNPFGGEKTGLPRAGEHSFRGGFGFPHSGHDGGFHPRDTETFDNPRKRKPGSIMCLICKVECGTLEGLDLHSQSREHQRKARDMVLSIKQQNKKKQKVSKVQASAGEGRDGGRPKNMGFQGRGNKR